MDKSALVSVIMPVYNGKEYLKDAIDSILSQTYDNWEFIIVNEYGSNDGSWEILEEYASRDKRFVLIQNTIRLGISASMNVAIDNSKGDYIARMDSDDISLPDRFEKQIRYMEDNPDIMMCGTQFKSIGTVGIEWKIECNPDLLKSNLLFYSPSVHPTVMFRGEFFRSSGLRYNDNYNATEDYDLFSKVGHIAKIGNLDEILFEYRLMPNNATYKNNDIGKRIYTDIMKRQFENLGLELDDELCMVLSPHYSLHNKTGNDLVQAFMKADLFLKDVLLANERKKIYNRYSLIRTLNRRFTELYRVAKQHSDNKIIDKIWNNSILKNDTLSYPSFEVSKTPIITVILPLCNSGGYVLDAFWSILNQDVQNFEVLVINEYGSSDDIEALSGFFSDSRIRYIQNQTKLGLAESLNEGMRQAKGKYIARCDSDDVSTTDRFRIQLNYMESHPECGLCGSWQNHYSAEDEWIHKPSENNVDLRARLLFDCEICHSTVFLRKDVFISNNLFYKNNNLAEDWELWNRAIKITEFHNVPKVLGFYREGVNNITDTKMSGLLKESAIMTANNITDTFGIIVDEKHIPFMTGWYNLFFELDGDELKKALNDEKRLITKIWETNRKDRIMDEEALMFALTNRWNKVSGLNRPLKKYKNIDKMLKPSLLERLLNKLRR